MVRRLQTVPVCRRTYRCSTPLSTGSTDKRLRKFQSLQSHYRSLLEYQHLDGVWFGVPLGLPCTAGWFLLDNFIWQALLYILLELV